MIEVEMNIHKIKTSVIKQIISIRILLIVLALIIGQAGSACANNKFSEQRYRGWLWFDESSVEESTVEKKEEVEDQVKDESKAPTLEQMRQAKRENEQFSEELDLLKHLAVRHPDNLEYIKLYKLKEKQMMDNAQILGLNWLMANFLNPEILNELENPQNIYGRDILGKEKKVNDKSVLQSLSNKIELFVFRQDGCPYCSTLEKHLKTFADKYGFKVEAITPDNSQSKYFKSNSSPELISALGLEVMPTVIAVVNDNRQRFELARGAVSIVELEEKALLLAEHLNKAQVQSKQENNMKLEIRK